MSQADLARDETELLAAYRAASVDDPLLFVRGLNIPSDTRPNQKYDLFNSCIQPFQLKCLQDLAPSLVAVRDGGTPPVRRFWWERTKGAAKDSDLAACVLWLVAFARRPCYVQVGAADNEQAGIVKQRISDLLFYNPWLAGLVKVQQNHVRQAGGPGRLHVLSADVAGAHGATPDVLIVNELSHIVKWEFVENLMDNADKVARGLAIVATNAGFKGSKAEMWRRNAMDSPDWSVHVWARPAPWIGEASLRDAERRNVRSRFRRLWWGEWVSGKGDALDERDIDRCFRKGAIPMKRSVAGWVHLAGLDLGITHDHSGLVVLAVNVGERRIRLVHMRAWEPGRSGEVDLTEVEEECDRVNRTYLLAWFGYDPTEARMMSQRLKARGVPMREVSFASPKNLTAMARALVQVVEAGMLELWDDEDGRLRRDFGKFSVADRGGRGLKLEAVSDEYGHADVGTALVVCLPKALDLLEGVAGLGPGDDVACEDDSPLTDGEVSEMPDELRELYDMYGEEPEGWPVRRRGE